MASQAKSSGVQRGEQLRQRGYKDVDTTTQSSYLGKNEEINNKQQERSDFAKLEEIIAPIVFTGLSIFTRLYQIGKSQQVTWDEAHFGKFGNYYLKREHYHDVHPPYAKMTLGLFEKIAGTNTSFEWSSGTPYPDELNFTTIRILQSMFSVMVVPLVYYTAKNLKLSIPAVWLATLMILLEHSHVTLSKFILLDSMLLFHTSFTLFCLTTFHRQQKKPFSAKWYFWLVMTGASIGFVTGVKMVGLFATALIGVYTLADLWIKFGDTKMPYKVYLWHWITRIVSLIFVPIAIFMVFYKIHFVVLNHTGPGDANMSSLFQANLVGNDIGGGPLDLAFGSRFTLKNQGLNGGLLHSHVQTFPEGSEQQQVTTYHHKDSNNEWLIEHKRFDDFYDANETIRYIEDGDVIRFMHPATGRNMHSHNIQAPLTKSKWEVSCYGNMTIGDEKDNWVVEVVENLGNENKSRIHPLSTSIRFRHEVLGCYLSGEGNNLPPWGFRQGEVTCDPKASKRDKKTWWNIENHWNDRLPDASDRVLPKSAFLRDFIQLLFAQMASNNALVPDPDKQDDLTSDAWEWPTLHVGLRMCGWGSDNVRYFLLGHPTTTWLTSIGVVIFGIVTFGYICRWQRQYVDFSNEALENYAMGGVVTALGWLFHFFPFLVMGRVTYWHHYSPCYGYVILNFAFLMDHFTKNVRPVIKYSLYGFLYLLTIGIFILFAPISFGMTGEPSDYEYLNWFSSWRIS